MRDYSLKCCPQPYSILTRQNNCIRREIENEYAKLCELHNKTTKLSNLCWLSESNEIDTIFQEKCNPQNTAKLKLKIVAKIHNDLISRRDQFPVIKKRKLEESKQLQAGKSLKASKNKDINHIRNATVKEKSSRPTKLKKKYKVENLKKPVQTKKEFSQLQTLKDAYIRKAQKRLKILSKPKQYPEYKPKRWILTKALKNYKATQQKVT